MMAMHSRVFTDDEASLLGMAIVGILSEQRTEEGRERYELTAEDVETLEALRMIRGGDDIELDAVTWCWLAVLLDTWMTDAPVKLYGAIFELSGTLQNLIANDPDRMLPYQTETRSQAAPATVLAVPAKAIQQSLF